ncbi:betaine-aldehyde dehydrogenase [Halobacteriales archaeon QS_1_68_17]|nr:MAG: betaine-aldehyde dehydrogenase [Halobacteriales archaeon QS_1_68_17]
MVGSEPADEIRERHREARERARSMGPFRAWIDGERVEASDGATAETRDPVVDEPIASVPACGPEDVDRAVEAAAAGFADEWSEVTPAERSRRLFEWTDVLADHVEELAFLECLDTGKPRADARGEIEGATDTLEYYASVCRSQSGDQIPAREDVHLFTRQEPFGVVGQITPWNFPAWAAAWKLGPALAAGNASVLKPSASSPLSTIRMAELTEGILPDGVVNVVPGAGRDVGQPLTEHPDVAKVSFTGSTAVGRGVMKAAAERVAPVTLELGGKSPFIVFPDADLETAVDAVAAGIFYSTGEICDAFSRALVHEDVLAEFTDRFVERAESYVLGDPLAEDTTMGPLTTRDQFGKVSDYVDAGRREGATLLTGGGPPDDPALADGWYFEPTVFGDVDNDMRIAREEIFGPVQTIIPFGSYEEAIEIANDTDYGLAAGIGTERTSLVHNAAADLEAGLVYVNEYGPILPEAPYGGYKDSGIGRDLGQEALDHYRQTKTVYVNLDDPSL